MMLSRLADSIFWMERYRERAENTARLVEVNLNLSLDLPQDANRQWAPLVHTTGDWDLFESKYRTPSEKNVVEFLTFDMDNPNSILACLSKARWNAQSIRQIITPDMWRELNTLYLYVKQASRRRRGTVGYEFFSRVKRHSYLFMGIFRLYMSRDDTWHFARLGSLLERIDKMTRLIDVKYFILLPSVDYVGTPYDDILWAALLKSAGAFEMYRRRWGQINPPKVLTFLVLDPHFPMAIRHCASEAARILKKVHGKGSIHAERLSSQLDNLKAENIIEGGVHEFMESMQESVQRITDDITETYFRADTAEVMVPELRGHFSEDCIPEKGPRSGNPGHTSGGPAVVVSQ